MKMRFVVALTGLVISLATQSFAQDKNSVDAKLAQQVRSLAMKYEEAYNKHEPAAVGALFTEDAVRVTPTGSYYGRTSIEKSYAKYDFQLWHSTDLYKRFDRVVAVGNVVQAHGIWMCTYQDDSMTKRDEGHCSWVLVRDGDTWKIRREINSESNFHAVAE
jgi:uncharacterized protein (TIGR02246 family)